MLHSNRKGKHHCSSGSSSLLSEVWESTSDSDATSPKGSLPVFLTGVRGVKFYGVIQFYVGVGGVLWISFVYLSLVSFLRG